MFIGIEIPEIELQFSLYLLPRKLVRDHFKVRILCPQVPVVPEGRWAFGSSEVTHTISTFLQGRERATETWKLPCGLVTPVGG